MAYIGSTPTSQNFISGTDYFNGDGSTVAFTLTRTVNSVNDVEVVVNNVVQQPNSYTVSGTTLTLSVAPSSGTSNVYVRYISTTTQVITPSQGTVNSAQLGLITTIPTTGGNTITVPTATGTMLTTASGGATGTSMVLIASATASASATIDFTSIDNTAYSGYRIYINNVVPTSNAVNLLLRFSNSGTFQTASYTWQNWRWTTAGTGVTGQGGTASGIALNAAGSDNIANIAASGSGGACFVIDIAECANTDAFKRVNYQGYYLGSAQLGIVGNGLSPSASAIDGFRFLMDSGTIASGTFYLYGIKNA